MSYEIRPAQVISGLIIANQRAEDIVGKADAIVPAVNALSESPVLRGRGYDALGNTLRGEYTALASVFRIAGTNFITANDKHLEALDHVSQYGYLNMEQILDEINQINDTLREIRSEINRARANRLVEARYGTAFGTTDTSALVNRRNMWEARLNTVEKKRDDFEAYISSSAGLYDGILDLLKCRIERMEIATFCPVTNVMRVPTIEEMEPFRKFEEMVIRDSYGNIIDFKWGLIRGLGQRPYSEWTVAEFAAFALLMEEMTTLEDYTQLLNALLDPLRENIIDPTTFTHSFQGIFGVCRNKFAGIKVHLLNNYEIALNQNDVTRQHNILGNIGLLSAVQMAVGQPPQFLLDGPLTLSQYMITDPRNGEQIEFGVQVNVARIRATFVNDPDGFQGVHMSGSPREHYVVTSNVLLHNQIQDGVTKVAGEFAEGVNTGTVRIVASAADTEFMSWLIGEIPVIGTVTSAMLGIANVIGDDSRQIALVNALVEPHQLASIASNLHMDSVVIFDGSAHQQVISVPTLTTGEQLWHFDFDTLEEVYANPHDAVRRIVAINLNNGGAQ